VALACFDALSHPRPSIHIYMATRQRRHASRSTLEPEAVLPSSSCPRHPRRYAVPSHASHSCTPIEDPTYDKRGKTNHHQTGPCYSYQVYGKGSFAQSCKLDIHTIPDKADRAKPSLDPSVKARKILFRRSTYILLYFRPIPITSCSRVFAFSLAPEQFISLSDPTCLFCNSALMPPAPHEFGYTPSYGYGYRRASATIRRHSHPIGPVAVL